MAELRIGTNRATMNIAEYYDTCHIVNTKKILLFAANLAYRYTVMFVGVAYC